MGNTHISLFVAAILARIAFMTFHSFSPVFRLIRMLAVALLTVTATTSFAEATDAEQIDNPNLLALLRDLPAPQPVTIPWRPGRFTAFQVGSSEEGGARARGGHLTGQLYPAPHSGKAPYAVLLAGCGGTYVGANGLWLKLWARALQDIGLGALALDSFEPRGVKDGICGDGSKVWALRRVDDAHAALAWLATQPQVDSRRIVVMGMSNGGRTALLSVSATETARLHRFAAAVAFYPFCDGLPPHDLLAPALVLFGAADEGASPLPCEHFTAQRRDAAFPPQIKLYPEAFHLFDVYPRDDNYNAPEVRESRADVFRYLRRVLKLGETTVEQTPAPPR